MICDWRDLEKRSGEPGKNCYAWADKKITRTIDDHSWVSYRCVWHVPRDEPKIGSLIVEDAPPAPTRMLDKRSKPASILNYEDLRGY